MVSAIEEHVLVERQNQKEWVQEPTGEESGHEARREWAGLAARRRLLRRGRSLRLYRLSRRLPWRRGQASHAKRRAHANANLCASVNHQGAGQETRGK